ncbi:MAG: TraR/DksA family transcriptional regulator [Treponema sp.]|jgi:RNA polymerase-binding protein DksA|nr:TraR/DksA family transcriptional regulator [Treponema sp.]
MEKEFIEEMKEKLLTQKKKILASLASQNDDYKKFSESADSGDVVDIASDVVDGNLMDSLGAQDAQRLQLINNALDRIEQNKYGHCLKCNKEIPEERLKAIPYAFLCIECKNKEERRNR